MTASSQCCKARGGEERGRGETERMEEITTEGSWEDTQPTKEEQAKKQDLEVQETPLMTTD